MALPVSRKSFKIGLAVSIQYRRVMDSQPASHVAVASTRYAYLSSRSKNFIKNSLFGSRSGLPPESSRFCRGPCATFPPNFVKMS